MQGSPSETMPDKITPSTEAPVSLDATTLPEESVTFITEASCPPSLQPDMPSVEASLILEEPDNLTGMLSDHSERPTSSLEGSSSPSEEASSPVEAEKGSNASEGGDDDDDSTADKTGDKGPIPESPAAQVNESGKSKKKKKKRSKAPRFTKQQVEEGATPDCCGVANVASAEAPSAHPTLLAPGGADSPLVKALQVTTNPLASNLTPAVNGPTETTSKKKKKSKAKPRGPVVEKPPEGAGHMPQVVPMQDATQKGKPQAPEGSKESTKKKSKSKNKAGRAPDPGNPETSGTPCPSTNINVPSGLLPCPGLIPKAKLVKEPVLELKDSTGVDVAEFLTDILKNNPRDRMFLLKMEQDILEFIKDSNANIHSLSPMTSYHRLLAHRVATHFGLEHAVLGPKGTTLMLHKTANTRIPLQRFKEHFAVEESSPTPRKLILKRESPPASSQQSHGPAMALDRRSKSLEEREEEYRLARERIFNQSPMQSEPSKPNGNGKGEKSGERSAPPGKVGGLGVRRMHSADAEQGSCWHPSRAGVSVLRRAESAGEGGGSATHATSAAAQMNVAEAAAHFGESRCSTLVNCQSPMPRGPALPQDGGRMVHMRGGDPRFSGQTQPSAGVCYPAGPPSQQALLNHWALQRSPFLPAGGVPSPGHTELPCGQSPQHGPPSWGRNNNNHQAPGAPRSTQMHGGHAGHGNRGHTSSGNRALQQQQSQSFRDVDGTQGLREQQYMGLQHTPTSSSSATMPLQHHNQQWRGPQPNPYQAMCNTAVPLGSMGAQCSHKQFASSVAQAWQPDVQTAHGSSSTGQSMPMNLRTPDLREGTNGPGTQHHYGLTGPVRNPAHAKQNSQNVPRGQIQYRHWPPGHMDHYSTQSVQGQYPMHPGPGPPGNYSSQNARGHYSTQGPLGHVGHYPSQGGRVAGPGGHGLQHVMPNGTSLMPPSHHEGVSFHAHTLSGMLGPGGCPIAGEAEGAMHQLNISPPASAERGSRRGGGSSGWEMSLMYSADKGSSQLPGGSQLQEACAPTQHARTDGPPARPPPAWYPQQYSSAALHSGHGNTGLDHRLAVGVATSDVPNGYPHALASTLVGGTEQTKTGKRKGRGKKGARQPPLAPPERLHSQSHIQPHMMEMQR